MAIRFRHNLYRGVNAHFHSAMQHEPGEWESFHSKHISDIAEAIDAQLPSGYLVQPEKGLQIREYHPTTGEQVIVRQTRRPKPDLTIYDTAPSTPRSTSTPASTATPTLTLPATESIDRDYEIYLPSIIIREVLGNQKLGKPITWIELLSPTNKPPNGGYLQYHEKRIATLESGIALIEIDYLHETRSPIPRLRSYPDHEPGAYPYTITVTNPRPSLEAGKMNMYGFTIDETISPVEIPLSGNDTITLDFDAVYQRTYRSIGAFSYGVDYEQYPENFNSYTLEDQQRIAALMTRAKQEDDANS